MVGGNRFREVPAADIITYGIEDVHAWMVARVALMCQHLGHRSAPTVAWRAGSTPGRFALTVTCAAGPERLALAATLRIR